MINDDPIHPPVIFIGLPGSGKTTLAKEIERRDPSALLVSSDDYFYSNPDESDYKIIFEKLGISHATCLHVFTQALVAYNNRAPVRQFPVVHNTNTSIEQIAPYIQIGRAFSPFDDSTNKFVREPIIVHRVPGGLLGRDHPLDSCLRRQKHGVPSAVIDSMRDQIIEMFFAWPRFWPNVYEVNDDKANLITRWMKEEAFTFEDALKKVVGLGDSGDNDIK